MITPNDLIQLANRWASLPAGTGGGESVWRASISRAYYGAFHTGWSFLIDQVGVVFRGDGKSRHWFAQQALMRSGHSECVAAGRSLCDLQAYRGAADYELRDSAAGAQNVALLCHELAVGIRDHISLCIPTEFGTIRSAIADWQRREGLRNS